MKRILVTGSSGLIGSEVCTFFSGKGWEVHGIDNNMRAYFFGPSGDNRRNQQRLEEQLTSFTHHELDVRDRSRVLRLVAELAPDAVVHTAAQPSHDKASAIPFEDFDTNAVGTLNLLEGVRRYSLQVPFVFFSTNKVYGDRPNSILLREEAWRWEYDDPVYHKGIAEDFPIDQSKHSLFGASKTAADILVQEYGRYFGMPTCCLRGGCLTGPNHAGVELHGFLSYLIKCNLEEKEYTIFGYKGKQVRDNIHAYDVASFCYAFVQQPGTAEVYNLGGGKENTISILEAFQLIESISGIPMKYNYMDQHRIGDHICYYSDLTKIKAHYPDWRITKSLNDTFREIYQAWQDRMALKEV